VHRGSQAPRSWPARIGVRGVALPRTEGHILVEVKAVEHVLAVHKAQVITYLKLSGIETGLLVNFNVPILVQGLRRLVRGKDFFESTP